MASAATPDPAAATSLTPVTADASLVMVATTDAQGNIVFASPQLLQFGGLSVSQLSAQWLTLVHPDDYARTAEQWGRALELGQNYQLEFRFRRHDGEYRWIRCLGHPQFDDHDVQQWIVSVLDVEALRNAGHADLATDFSFLAELIPQLVWTTDATGYHTYFNQRWTDFTGYTLADSVGPDMWNNLLHPDDQPRARQRWSHSLATGEFYEIEYRFRSHADGYRWFLGQALPVRDTDGQIVKWFGTCTDIHDQKMQELALRKREQDFTTMANAIPQLAWMADEHGNLFWYNQRWFEFTGTTLEQMQSRTANTVHPDYQEEVSSSFRQAIADNRDWEATFPLRRHDGQYRWFLSRALPVRDEAGHILRWCGTNTDITDQKELQEQLERAYSDLEAKVMFRTLDLERELQELRRASNN